jgi:hypothetical protein
MRLRCIEGALRAKQFGTAQLLLRDLTKPSLEVYISLRLSGFGVELQTNPSVAALNTFVLQPGVPLTISGSELSPLFAQMLAQGVNYDDLLTGCSLPGGYYTWEVVAYLPDGRQVSNTGRASMSVFKAQPPQITFPAHRATVAATGITTVPFQWISRSATPAGILGTIYDMKIYELPDEVTDPNVAVLSGLLPIFNTQTASNSYFYGPGDPLLQPGKRYAIVVQAQDIGGGDSYENQGLSQVVEFKVAGEPLALIGCEGDGRSTLGLASRCELGVNRAVEGCQEGHYQESGDACAGRRCWT